MEVIYKKQLQAYMAELRNKANTEYGTPPDFWEGVLYALYKIEKEFNLKED